MQYKELYKAIEFLNDKEESIDDIKESYNLPSQNLVNEIMNGIKNLTLNMQNISEGNQNRHSDIDIIRRNYGNKGNIARNCNYKNIVMNYF